MQETNKKLSRRTVIKSASFSVGIGLLSSVTAQTSGAQSQSESSPPYEVNGEKHITTKYTEDEFIVEKEYRSEDLINIKGEDRFTKTKRIDRPFPYEDDVPLMGVKESTEPWHTYIATEEEWRTAGRAQEKRRTASQTEGVSIQHDHAPIEDQFCGIAVWDYEFDNQDHFYTRSPINVVCKGYDVEDVEDIFTDAGWFDEESFTVQWPRYAWDSDRERFCGPQGEPQSEYSHAVSKRAGLEGRCHAKFWELEDGIVSIQAHEDTAHPHSVASYDRAKNRVGEIILNDDIDTGIGRVRYLENKKKDHNGQVPTYVNSYDSINRSC